MTSLTLSKELFKYLLTNRFFPHSQKFMFCNHKHVSNRCCPSESGFFKLFHPETEATVMPVKYLVISVAKYKQFAG